MKRTIIAFTAVVCLFLETNAQVINVPATHTSIQAGIDSASIGDTVLVAEGTYFENINFRGKPITVASQFILDGDTSHISKTIIDGSQPAKPDSASTVLMISGEDTTSVLMGFTITGGSGTVYKSHPEGGGIYIEYSGGKVIYNIIKRNLLEPTNTQFREFVGCGICAAVSNNHTAIIRHNIIRENIGTALDGNGYGAGVVLWGGRIVFENNIVTDNSIHSKHNASGAGVRWTQSPTVDMIDEVIIRNNLITGNRAMCTENKGHGGGLYLGRKFEQGTVQVYNNVIHNNYVEGYGGGIYIDPTRANIFNNTVWNNEATLGGNNLSVVSGYENDVKAEAVLFNNIFWSDLENGKRDFSFNPNRNYSLKAYNNILKEPFPQQEQITDENNICMDPMFISETSFELAAYSPAIGWGVDSLLIDTVWYYAPAKDLPGNNRPDAADQYIDAGAFESSFSRPDLPPLADLSYIGLWGRMLEPLFHWDSLHYVLSVPDTTSVTPQLDVLPATWEASIDMTPATDLGSPDPADRTTTITVTASDGITQKLYMVEFYLNSIDASLSGLSVSQGELEPSFEPNKTKYDVWLPYRSTETPEVTYTSTHPKASVSVTPAGDITDINKNTTSIIVVSEDGDTFQKRYDVKFSVDRFYPILSLVSDSVILNHPIEAVSNRNGQIYLLTEQTDMILDSLITHMIDSTAAIRNETVDLPTSGLDEGEYWLYAVNQYKSVSEAVSVTIFDTTSTGMHEFNNASFRLYPNPVDDMLYIETDQSGQYSVDFTSLSGQVVCITEMEGTFKQIDLSSFRKGVYFITIRSEDLLLTKKLVKQ